MINTRNVNFAKLREDAIIPSKRDEDNGYDIYSCFDENEIVLQPFECKLIPTGLISAFANCYSMLLRERGSTGVKNLKVNAGVIDPGYRDEIFIPIYNANDKPAIITKEFDSIKKKDLTEEQWNDLKILEEDYIVYPYSKAICQAVMVNVPKLNVQEKTVEELLAIKSVRGTGKIGSSGK